jgi:hypothetical protein
MLPRFPRGGAGHARVHADGADVDVAIADRPSLLLGVRIAAAGESRACERALIWYELDPLAVIERRTLAAVL